MWSWLARIFIAIFITVLVLVAVPQIVMLRALRHDGPTYAAILNTRKAVEDFQKKHGRLPESLSELPGGVPAVDLFCYDGSREIHTHRRIDSEVLRPGFGSDGFEVHFNKRMKREDDVRDVRVIGDFNGWDPERGRMKKATNYPDWWFTTRLKPGPIQYRFVIDGVKEELREIDLHLAMPQTDSDVEPVRPEVSDLGAWLYDPQNGLVVLACTGGDTKNRRTWQSF